jgi:putative nucleotidyltransferase with HDIG domain
MVSFLKNSKFIKILTDNFSLLLLNSIGMLPFALIFVVLYKQYNYVGVLLFIFPMILARYTFALYIESKSQYNETVDALMRAVEARDKYTEGHSERVADLVMEIAQEIKYNNWGRDKLYIASLLHDVGKIGIDDFILNKPGMLTGEEYKSIKEHPEIGYNILKDVKNLKDIVYIVRHHHERYDGLGYPSGTKGEDLAIDVYIVQLADCIDAMATTRPYRKALTQEEIYNELVKNRGTQFHPQVVDAYLRLLKKKNKMVQE